MRARFLRTRHVAKILGVSPRTVEDWRIRRVGPPYIALPMLRTVLYDEAEVLAWVRAGERALKCPDNGAASIEPEVVS